MLYPCHHLYPLCLAVQSFWERQKTCDDAVSVIQVQVDENYWIRLHSRFHNSQQTGVGTQHWDWSLLSPAESHVPDCLFVDIWPLGAL